MARVAAVVETNPRRYASLPAGTSSIRFVSMRLLSLVPYEFVSQPACEKHRIRPQDKCPPLQRTLRFLRAPRDAPYDFPARLALNPALL